MKLPLLNRRDLDGVADLLKPADQAGGGLVGIGAIEVRAAEFAPFGAVAQHVPGGGQDGGGDGADGFFRAAAGAQALELGLEIAGLPS